MASYATKEYWNARYEKDQMPFDWFQRFDMVRRGLLHQVHRQHKVLIVGCGNSTLGESLYKEGIRDIVSVDFSSVVIEQMRLKHSDKPGMIFQEMDATSMTELQDASFDIVLDKATLDTMLCGESSSKSVSQMLREVYRVLRTHGKYIMISHAKKTQRLNYLSKPEFKWSIDTVQLERPSFEALPLDDDTNFHYMTLLVHSSIITYGEPYKRRCTLRRSRTPLGAFYGRFVDVVGGGEAWSEVDASAVPVAEGEKYEVMTRWLGS